MHFFAPNNLFSLISRLFNSLKKNVVKIVKKLREDNYSKKEEREEQEKKDKRVEGEKVNSLELKFSNYIIK